MEPDIIISHSAIIPSNLIAEFVETFNEHGLEVEVEDRGIEMYAALEWLIPTAIVVLLTKKYTETIIQEAAKDHYALFKSSMSTLLKRVVGRDREIHIKLITAQQTPKKLTGSAPGAVSVYIESQSGQLIKFITEDSLAPEQHERCLEALFQVLQDHTSKFPADSLTTAIHAAELDSTKALIMRFDPVEEVWYLWRPLLGPPVEAD